MSKCIFGAIHRQTSRLSWVTIQAVPYAQMSSLGDKLHGHLMNSSVTNDEIICPIFSNFADTL